MRPTFIKTDGTCVDVMPKNGSDFSLKELQTFVGGYIEVLRLSPTQIMVCNEGGKLLPDAEPNQYASLVVRMAGYNDSVFGNVVVCDSAMVK